MRPTLLVSGLILGISAGSSLAAKEPFEVLQQARLDWEAGKHGKAIERVAKLKSSLMADHIALLRASWLREQGQLKEAMEAAESALALNPPSEVRARVYREIALIHIAENDLLSAYRAQRRAWKHAKNPEFSSSLVAELAKVFELNARPGDALRLYRSIWSSWPLSEQGTAAFNQSRYLERATGAPPAEVDTLILLAERLRESYRCERAIEAYDEAEHHPELKPEAKREIDRGRADCLFQTRRYPEAVGAYAELEKAEPANLDFAIRLARSYARGRETTTALKKLRAIEKRGRGRVRARAQYLQAVLLRDRQPKEADRLYRAVEKQQTLPSLARIARWALAWSQFNQGKYEASIRRLEPLVRGSRYDVEVQRAQYWTAIARRRLKQVQGNAGLQKIVDETPLSYYGFIAADRLGQKPRWDQGSVGARTLGDATRAELRTRTLVQAGIETAARDELESWMRAGKLSREERVTAAGLWQQVGDHFRGVRLIVDGFGGTLDEGVDPAWREAWELAWPQPFSSRVKAAIKEFEFDPSLVYAVMREESTYRPGIVSPADARGLMQIIPPTAQRIADQLKLNSFEVEQLFLPEINIRFGTFYLQQLLAKFDGTKAYAIASYNAGPDAVKTWLNDQPYESIDRFVESVPYGETRRYLRKVMRSQRVYELLYRDEAPADSARRPAQLDTLANR